MTPHELGAATLMGDIAPGEVKRMHTGELFVGVRELVLSELECYFVTAAGSRLPISLPISLNSSTLGTDLKNGGILTIAIPGAFIKATTS